MIEKELIEGYKEDFKNKTGKALNISVCSKWETLCQLYQTSEINYIFSAICISMSWEVSDILAKSNKRDIVFKRDIISFILYNNGYRLVDIARLFNKDHTAIISALRRFEFQVNTDLITVALLREVMELVNIELKENIVNKTYLKEVTN
jgi:chromosomal replication initiation ATPase DnaA